MPRRKSKPKEPETQPTPTVLPTLEKLVEVPAPVPKPETQPATSPTTTLSTPTATATESVVEKPATEKLEVVHPAGFTIKETTWEEFERFAPTPRRERGKSPLRQVYEMAASGKVVKIEGLAPAQVRAVLAAVSNWNYREKEITGRAPVQVKYDMKAGVVYLAPAKPETEKKQ
jgi:hypothetical protein